MSDTALTQFETILLERRERLLAITLNRPDSMKPVDAVMHAELPEVLAFAASDPGSDVILLTGAGRAFSVGGDLTHMAHNAEHPHLFDAPRRQVSEPAPSGADDADPERHEPIRCTR